MVGDVVNHRKRRHRIPLLNLVEDEISKWKAAASVEEDVSLWRTSAEKFKNKFSTRSTWMLIRKRWSLCPWSKGVWFQFATPKLAFLTWITMHNRLSTGDRMLKWGGSVNAVCSLCGDQLETRNHLYFECSFSIVVWENLARGVMGDDFTCCWRIIVELISGNHITTKLFALRYVFQTAIHGLWMERNGRRHGEKPLTADALIRIMERNIRNRFASIQTEGNARLGDGLGYWFSTRPMSS